jgi:hypothetical protein
LIERIKALLESVVPSPAAVPATPEPALDVKVQVPPLLAGAFGPSAGKSEIQTVELTGSPVALTVMLPASALLVVLIGAGLPVVVTV